MVLHLVSTRFGRTYALWQVHMENSTRLISHRTPSGARHRFTNILIVINVKVRNCPHRVEYDELNDCVRLDCIYNDGLVRNGYTVSGVLVAAATSCQSDYRQICLLCTPIIYAEPMYSGLDIRTRCSAQFSSQ